MLYGDYLNIKENTMKLEPLKHMHADVIVAWANGATIEYYAYAELGNEKGWFITTDPAWDRASIYRVQPEKNKETLIKEVFINFRYDIGVTLSPANPLLGNCELVFDAYGRLIDCVFKQL